MEFERMLSEKGHPLVVFENYKFRKFRVLKKTEEEAWCCTKKNCNAKIYISNSAFSRKSGVHNHQLEETLLIRQKISNSLKRKAEELHSERPQKLIRREVEAQSGAIESISMKDIRYIRNNLNHARLQRMPKLPKSSEELQSALMQMDLKTSKDLTQLAMAAVAEMGEVDEIHSNEEGIVVNGDITKDIDMENRDIEMESKDVDMENVTVNKISQEDVTDCKDVSMDSKDASIDSKDASIDSKDASIDSKDASIDSKDVDTDSKDVDMERDEETGSQSAADEDSQDSHDSRISQDDKSPGSPDSQDEDSNMVSERVNEEDAGLREDKEDTNTNGSLPRNDHPNLPQSEEVNENSNISSRKNEDEDEDEDEDSRSSIEETNEQKTQEQEQDPLFNENSEDAHDESDKKSQHDDQDQEVSQDGSESKSESARIEPSENGTEERAPSAASSAISAQEVHEIEDDDRNDKLKTHETIELNESEDEEGDVMIVDVPKTNGMTEVIDLIDITPEKKIKEKKEKESITPRRSSRNLNKSKSYVESDKEDTPPPPAVEEEEDSEESDIEEIMPQDPLAVNDQITVERIPSIKKVPAVDTSATIVVKDTKRLVEIASKSNQNTSGGTTQQGKKEPTLVIIDTNSILSGRGRGPIPVPTSKTTSVTVSSTPNFNSMLPVAVPAQGMYPANMRATITPIPVNAVSMTPKSSPVITPMQSAVAPLLPTLTDDMFVVEAPSFIVPYVYEKPPVKVLKDFVADIKKQIQDNKTKDKKDKKEKKEQIKSEKGDKKKGEGDDSDVSFSSGDESDEEEKVDPASKKPYSYFDSPLGKFFIDIGMNMVQEYVQTDLLKQQKRKRDREQGANPETNKTIASLMKNIEMSKENNEHFKMAIKKCEFCNFKTESKLAMAYHLETPHMKNFVYKCNFCPYEVRSPHDILFHMEAEHAVRGHLERAPAFHQCPSCPFEDNQKGKLSRHLVVCARKFKPDRNLEPPPDWEPPAKIPRMPKMRATGLNATVAAYQTLAANKGAQQYQFLSKMQLQANAANSALNRGRGRPTLGPNVKTQPIIRPQGMIFKQQTGGQVLVPANYQLTGNQVFQVVGGTELGGRLGPVPGMAFVPSSAQVPGSMQTSQVQQTVKKPANTPSISITPLPRGTTASPAMASKPGDTNSKNSFVICEICDGYIKDLEQLRNHMQWIHKIKIHPKMIYNRPPLNCQKCQFRFFTDQGLERHLLGSHGLVTSSMQDAANKSKDSGRCPVCGRVYQWKLLNHVARDHNMTLKPAHLSYKCTVCTATFGMYKQFENHVYSAHSVVAKRVMDKKSTSASPSAVKATDMKPLKINDEITIIPQPAKSTNGATKEGSPAPKSTPGTSKNEDETCSMSRAERLARRNASATDSD